MIDETEQLSLMLEQPAPEVENAAVAEMALAALCAPETLTDQDSLANADLVKSELNEIMLETISTPFAKPQMVKAALLFTQGLTIGEIATSLSVNYGTVQKWLNRPEVQSMLSRYLSIQAAALPSVTDRLKHHAHEALDRVTYVMRHGREENALKAGFKILEMAGYGAVKKVEATHNVSVPTEQASALLDSIKQSMEARKSGYQQFLERSSEAAEPVVEVSADVVDISERRSA